MSIMKTERRGFASLSPEKRKAIASKGGQAAHEKGTAHQWTSAEAKAAGRKGGQVSRGGRGKLPTTPPPADRSDVRADDEAILQRDIDYFTRPE